METREIPCIYLKKGLAVSGFHESEESCCGLCASVTNPLAQALAIRNHGDQGIFLFDFSDSDEEHETALGILKDICRNAYIPVYAAGNVKRMEDVKKLLYAGCEKAFLNFSKESNRAILEEASKRFGKERIGVFAEKAELMKTYGSQIEEYAGALLTTEEEAEQLLSCTKLPVFVHCPDRQSCIEKQVSEEEIRSKISWDEFCTGSDGLIPCVVQDYQTNEVLMVAYMNQDAFEKTVATGRMTYWSRSRQEIWVKGLTSGHFQFLRSLTLDCDKDTLLARVAQLGAACHTGHHSCFFQELVKRGSADNDTQKILENVYRTIADRKKHPKEGSYTNYLFDKGMDKILKKVGEEATETVIAAKNPDKKESVYEISDLMYHLMVLMVEKGLKWEDITGELADRE